MRSRLGVLRTSGPVQAATLLLPVVALLIVALAAGSRPARSQALSVSIDDVTVTEGDTGTAQATFTVSLSAADPVSVSVQFATADGTAQSGEDFVAASGTLTLSGSVRIRQVSVDIIGDTVAEDDETFTVVLSNPMGAPIADGEGIGTITDDDEPPPAPSIDVVKQVTDVNGSPVEPGDILEYTVTVTNAGQQGVGVAGLSDFIPGGTTYVPGSLEVTSGANAGAKTDAAGDDQAEFQKFDPPPSRAFFRLGASATATSGGTLAAGASTTVAFRVQVDAGAPDGAQIGNQASVFAGSLTVVSNAVTSVVSNQADLVVTKVIDNPNPSVGDTVTFTVTLTNNGPQDATGVRVTDQGTEIFPSATPSQGTYDPATGLWNVGDLANGATATLTLQITFTQAMIDAGAFTNRAEITDAVQVDPDLNNNIDTVTVPSPTPTLSIDDVTVTEGNSGTTPATFTVSLSTASANPISVQFATADGTAQSGVDFVAESGTLTFIPGETSRSVSVDIVGDTIVESTETFAIVLSSPVGATIADGGGVGTITDDDGPLTNAVDDTATTPFNTPVTIVVDANDTGAGIEVTNVGTPTSGSAVENADGTITYTPDTGFSGPDSFTYTITADDGDTDTATVTVTVEAGPPPTPLNAVDDTATTPFNTAVTVNVLANDSGDGIEVTNVSTPANGSAVENSDGSITYTPTAGFSGQDSFTYTITDAAGQTDTGTVTVTVGAAPAPAITLGTPTVNGQPAGSPPGPSVTAGSALTIAVPVSNTGPVAVANLTGTIGSSGTVTCAQTTLASGASTTCIVASTAAAGAQQVAITITALGANGLPVSAETTAFYTGAQAPPTITGVTPASGPTTGNTVVTISGTGFQPGAGVRFGDSAATVGPITPTTISVTTPPHAAGLVAVTVTNPDQQSATLADGFTYVAAPTITTLDPPSGPEAGGTLVTITGEGFVPGQTHVTFGGTPATAVSCAGTTQCIATSPPGTGTVSVRVTAGGQQSADTAAAAFRYIPPPQPMTLAVQVWRQIPPLVSENQVEGTIVPVVGGVVEALVEGVVCGQGVTDGQGRVQLVVAADPPASGCGQPGRALSFRVNGAAAAGDPLSFRSGGQAAVTLLLPGPMPPPRR